MLRYWTPGFSPKRLWKRLSQKKHMLTNRDYEQALSCFIPRLFEFCPEPYVCISTLLCECCFCYNNHFGAIGYTRWHRDQLDRGRVYQLVEKTSTLRLAHMMYSACLGSTTLWGFLNWGEPQSSMWYPCDFRIRFSVPVSGPPPAGTSCKEAMLPHHHHDRCTVTVYKHL